jgi:molybdenum cofactor cytidylyltransferase
VVVVGYQAEQIRKALDGMDVRFVFNPEYEAGRQASVRVGLANIYADGEAVMIGLADQPLLNDHDLDEFINSYASGDREKIFIPYFNDIRGNPILIPPPIARQIQYDMKNSNCRKFIDGNPELTIRYKAPNSHFTTDIDTHEDALLFANRPGPGKSPILERE